MKQTYIMYDYRIDVWTNICKYYALYLLIIFNNEMDEFFFKIIYFERVFSISFYLTFFQDDLLPAKCFEIL